MRFMKKPTRTAMLLAAVLVLASLAACTRQENTPAKKTPVFSDVTPGVVSGNVTVRSAEDVPGDVTFITCTGSSASVRGSGAAVTDGRIEITTSGIYWLKGSWNGSVTVVPEAESDGELAVRGSVELLLDNFKATSSDGPALIVKKASVAIITLVDGTDNVLTDAETYSAAAKADSYDAALFSKSNLILRGTGKLTVDARYDGGIKCKDILTVEGGEYAVTAPGNGITGHDAVLIGGGTFAVTAGGDAIQATEELDKKLGYIAVYGGSFTAEAGDEAFAAKTDVLICAGDFRIKAGGNGISAGIGLTFSGGTVASLESGNDGLKAKLGEVRLGGGSVSVTAAGDAIDTVACVISGGTASLTSTGKHGINASGDVAVTGGTLSVTTTGLTYKTAASSSSGSHPGSSWGAGTPNAGYDLTSGGLYKVEQKGIRADGDVIFSGGTVVLKTTGHAVSADGDVSVKGSADVTIDAYAENSNSKGITAAGDITVEGGTLRIERSHNGIDAVNVTVSGGTVSIKSSNDGIHAEGAAGTVSGPTSGGLNLVTVSGGSVTIDASGDGIDSKGSIVLSGGSVSVSGASDTAGAPLSRGSGSCSIRLTGGSLFATGTAGKTEAPLAAASGAVPYVLYTGAISAGDQISVRDLSGQAIIEGVAEKDASCAILGSDKFKTGTAYLVSVGSYTATVTLSGVQTTVGSGR